ncbi:MAG: hypothetical protein II259_06375, partial [Selenomonadaceae bacterium]|nr:hypothetical protein [Selenomonadaceae bacterium]
MKRAGVAFGWFLSGDCFFCARIYVIIIVLNLCTEVAAVAYMALYRKWRPGGFDELVGQEHVSRTLSNAIN